MRVRIRRFLSDGGGVFEAGEQGVGVGLDVALGGLAGRR
jgi:hypothetical protein